MCYDNMSCVVVITALSYGLFVCVSVICVGRAVFPIIIGDSLDSSDDSIGRRKALDPKTFNTFPG